MCLKSHKNSIDILDEKQKHVEQKYKKGGSWRNSSSVNIPYCSPKCVMGSYQISPLRHSLEPTDLWSSQLGLHSSIQDLSVALSVQSMRLLKVVTTSCALTRQQVGKLQAISSFTKVRG